MNDVSGFRYHCIAPLLEADPKLLVYAVSNRMDELRKEGIDVSRSSLYKWYKDYRKEGMRGLENKYDRCGARGHSRLDPRLDEIIGEVLGSYPELSVGSQAIVQEMFARIFIHNMDHPEDVLVLPSKVTLYKRIRAYQKATSN